MMKVLRKKRKSGFTLIELIVVIAILGILAAIAVPRFIGVSANAKIDADDATARSIESAINIAIASGDILSTTAITAFGGILVPDYLQAIPTSQTQPGAAGGWVITGDYTNGFNVAPGATATAGMVNP